MATLKDLSVSFLSLVRAPATGKGLTLKSAKPGERAEAFHIAKTDDERMVAYGVVYAPDQVDSHGDTADAKTIRRAAYEFMREGRLKNIDTEHSFTSQMAYVAESWLVRVGDDLFPDEPEGAWAVGIQIHDADLWQALKAGELTGISLAGVARMDPDPGQPANPAYTEKDAHPPRWFARLFPTLKANPTTPKETDTMNEDKVREIMRAEMPGLITDALKSAGLAKEPEKPADPAEAAAAAVAKALEGIEAKLDDKIARAVAKGVTEADPAGVKLVESFA
ncbi:MAG: XkdF-like putative serine protease domain-containing protein [Paracoccus sp. (in: a-proteobacteria)]|nr:XkdF-like putative serine protease domain-containing protein [Paracoccus sp. (in: a-proteobacteria)]